MKEILFQTIWVMESERKEQGRVPETVTRRELFERIRSQMNQELDELVQEGRIFKGDTLNDDYFKIIKE